MQFERKQCSASSADFPSALSGEKLLPYRFCSSSRPWRHFFALFAVKSFGFHPQAIEH